MYLLPDPVLRTKPDMRNSGLLLQDRAHCLLPSSLQGMEEGIYYKVLSQGNNLVDKPYICLNIYFDCQKVITTCFLLFPFLL